MNPEQLQAHADRIRASQVLGRSELMLRLFDFLVSCSLQDRAPKEIELAIDVFGKDAQFEVTRDAMVRVYMHKLRRKLDEYYLSASIDAGRSEAGRLTIPRGEYRLVFEEAAAATARVPHEPELEAPTLDDLNQPPDALAPPRPRSFAWPRVAIAVVVALLAANLLLALFTWSSEDQPSAEQRKVRRHSVWQPILADDKPIYVVMGDYYIFGELGDNSPNEPYAVRRLVREFNINSRNDLEQWSKDHPEQADRFMDVALGYLPVASAYALSDIAPLLQSSGARKQVNVIMASDLTSGMIRSSHVVYIGLISGMGMLRDIAFAGSRFRIGDTYDELIDRDSGQMYVSQSSVSVNNNTRYRDYGYFATFAGPSNNRIVILAGTRDVALMHTAEAASHAELLQSLTSTAKSAQDFEALYAVDAIDRMNLDGKLLLANAFNTSNIWASGKVATAATTNAALHAP